MISKTSRYRHTSGFSRDPEGRPLFPGVRPREIRTLPPILEHAVSAWDRPDLVAAHYYNDPEKWWLFGDANPNAPIVHAPESRPIEASPEGRPHRDEEVLFSSGRAGSTILVARDVSN